MKSLARAALGGLAWIAVVWTIYEEQRHLALYLGDPEIALGIAEYIDILVTLILLAYAGYEVFHLVGRTAALDRYLAAHPAIDALTAGLLAAFGWGIYRDLSHFHHLYLGSEGTLPFGDDFDAVAAALLVLVLLKAGNHMVCALRELRRRGGGARH